MADAGNRAMQCVEAQGLLNELLDDIDLLLVAKELKARGDGAGGQFFLSEHGNLSIG